MKSPCLHCQRSRWTHSPNDYKLPTFSACTKNLQPGPKENECVGLVKKQKGVIDLINDNVKKYHANGRA